jgi:hypothetical protein
MVIKTPKIGGNNSKSIIAKIVRRLRLGSIVCANNATISLGRCTRPFHVRQGRRLKYRKQCSQGV